MKSAQCFVNFNYLFFDQIVTCYKKWILYNNHKQSGQAIDHDDFLKHFPKPKLHQQKFIVRFWWSEIGVILFNFLKTNHYYKKIWRHVCFFEKEACLVNQGGLIQLHDNTRPHVTWLIMQKLTDLGYETLLHSPFFPDHSPTELLLF